MLILETKPIVEQLTEIYFQYENWHEYKLPIEQVLKYHQTMIDKGAIVVYQQDSIVLGYFEAWLINFEQFGRLVAHAPFNQLLENTTDGNLAYVANVWIHPDFRKGAVYKVLRNRFFVKCNHCEYYCGSRLTKLTQPVKVFKVSELVNKLYKGAKHGSN